MIRSPTYTVMTARKGKKIISHHEKNKIRTSKIYKWPIVRGFFNMIDMMVIGMRALMWSAEQQTGKEEEIKGWEMTVTVIVSIIFAIGLFVAIPYAATIGIGVHEEESPVWFNLIDGVIRILIFLGYIYAISFMKDVKTMFQYHGAEHMSIHAYEHKKKLTIPSIKKFSTLHPRCGTAFIMIVLVVSILLFSLIPPIMFSLFPGLLDMNVWGRKIILFLTRIAFLPIVAGVAYEVLKLGDKYQKNPLLRLFVWPGLLMQKITTKKPTAKQIEVAAAAVKKSMSLEKVKFEKFRSSRHNA